MSKMGKETVFLIESPHLWSGVWQRPHHITSRLARRFFCYYIYPQYLRNVLRRPLAYSKERKLKVNQRLHCISPLLFNGERFTPVLKHNRAKMTRIFQTLAQKHKDDSRILWIYDPHHYYLAKEIEHNRLVYDIMDEYQGFPWSPPGIEQEEKQLLTQADLVIAATYALYEAKKALAKNIHCLLSAVEFEHFNRAASEGNIPDDLLEIRKKHQWIAGYYGMVDMRIDQEMVAEAMAGHPEWAMVFIGPVVGDLRRLQAMNNVYFLGQRAYQLLPDYTRGFDVCIIPFKINKLTRHINPTKVLEYFAAARPVVTTAIPDIMKFYSHVGYIAEDKNQFTDYLHQAVSEKQTQERIEKGLQIARENSWDATVEKILTLLELRDTN